MIRSSRERGMALVIVVLTMLLIGILVPLLYYLTDNETKTAVRQKHATGAAQLAAAGVDRALWKLKETNDNWMDMLSSGSLAGYRNDVVYSDVNEGEGYYRISITSTAADRNVMIIVAEAKDEKANVYKAARATVRRTQINAAIHGHNIFTSTSAAGDFTTHWGPLYATGNMFLNTIGANQLYPRKFSTGSITVVNSTGVYGDRDASPSNPNSDSLEWTSYHEVPPIVTPDFDFYRASAAAMGLYYSANATISSTVTAPGRVFFFERNATFNNNNKFIQGIVIVMRNCTLNGNNTAATAPYANNYVVTPTTGTLEYQKNCPIRKNATGGGISGDTAAHDEYPGDGGLQTLKAFTFGSTTGGASGKMVSIKGFLYVGNQLSGGANTQVVHGALALSKTAVINSGTFEVFYDPTIEIRTLAAEIYIDKWEEISPNQF